MCAAAPQSDCKYREWRQTRVKASEPESRVIGKVARVADRIKLDWCSEGSVPREEACAVCQF